VNQALLYDMAPFCLGVFGRFLLEWVSRQGNRERFLYYTLGTCLVSTQKVAAETF
jgi:hypothetical protein